MQKYVLAMYDVRGIQNYIFRTAKVRDAIGASRIVEHIIEDALACSVKAEKGLRADLKWYMEEGAIPYKEEEALKNDVQVLYIGGGNAYVSYSSRSLAIRISRRMAKYTMEHTYSLQLATAIINKGTDYQADYKALHEKMASAKERMAVSKPLGVIPVMEVEQKTGYPITAARVEHGKMQGFSTESDLKSKAALIARRGQEEAEKRFDSLVTEKGDSLLATVHIDGNDMGMRIRRLIEAIRDYEEAVNTMRRISFAIDHSFKLVFEEMQDAFNGFSGSLEKFQRKETDFFIMKIVTAGDDITYVCNANIALATVEYFCKKISQYTINGNGIAEYGGGGFSVCAGVSFMGCHFPFNIAYEAAEACCRSAKTLAKNEAYRKNGRTGNWVDFQFCRNVHTLNLARIRHDEYVTWKGEQLLRRPYFIPEQNETDVPNGLEHGERSLSRLKEDMEAYIWKRDNIPRSYTKAIRDAYPLGEESITELCSFLRSRGRKLPESMYYENEDGERTALLYDALELADCFIPLEAMKEGE